MRYFKKKQQVDRPQAWEKWLSENQYSISDWVVAVDKKGSHLWDELGKSFGKEISLNTDNPSSIREALVNALFEEQNGICCYCGDSIKRTFKEKSWNYEYCSIEHFKPKHLSKELTFEYENLMLCCKASKLNYYEVTKTPRERPVNNIADVAFLRQLSEERIISYQKNKKLKDLELKPGDKIYFPNPPHCDDAKSEYDRKTEQISIINPTKDKHLINKLIFKQNGYIEFEETDHSLDDMIHNTINVLALNCDTLVDKRKRVWNEARQILDIIIQNTPEEILNEKLSKLILDKISPDKDGILEAFFFVEVAYYKLLFNIINE
jgi:hypothetical protein